ncbi:YhgE/Pip domain-containing protein [Microbacterium sp. NPDC056044]|uniref:YhgE/Pip domain-containing protein n=1 Tax=Microbacterium sp. NPDC056044 TaxID=3345690 RepID=UPI0035E1EE15
MAAFRATSGSPRLGRLAVIGLIVVTLLIGGILAWALAAPTAHPERLTAAIVNDDEPVTVDGQSVPLGRQFAAGLMAAQEPPQPGADPADAPPPSLDWVLTNDEDAAEGLAAGRYVAVVRIPPTFSADATSISGPGADARQAVVEVRTTPASAWLDPALTGAVTKSATAALGRELTGRYLQQVYAGFNSIAAEIGQAAAGADQVAAGAASAAAGAADLSTGASALSSGLATLSAGAGSLAAGLAQLDATAQPLPGAAADVAAGANRVAGSLDEALRQADAATFAFAEVVAQVCGLPGPGGLCDRATNALRQLEAADAQLRDLTTGARRVAVGNDALAAALPRLVGGIGDASAGAGDMSAGAAASSTGGQEVASGASSLASGAAQVDQGATEVASGLETATGQLPTYSDDDIDTLSVVVAEPVVVDQATPATGIHSVPLFTMIALWLGALVTAIAVQAVPTARLLSGTGSVVIGLRAVVPTVAICAAQGVVVGAAVLGSVGVNPLEWIAFVASAMLCGAVFGLANQGLAAAFGAGGRIIAALIAIVALAAGLAGTVPPVVTQVAASLPTAAATALLRAALTADAAGVVPAIIGLGLTAVAGLALVIAGVAARRRVSAEA